MDEDRTVNNETRKANVLLVDDKAENLLALESVLQELGQNLVRATSAREALRHLLLEDFALILLDVQMPGLSGFELAELIRERERTQHTPIIFVSAESVQEQNIFRGYSLGAVDYLTKPIDPEIVKSKVRFFSKLFLQQDQIRRQARQLAEANARLDELNAALEQRVRSRTLELERTNRDLAAEVNERRLSEARLTTEHAVTRALANASDVESAFTEILRSFIENMGAAVAARWELSNDGSLTCTQIESSMLHPRPLSTFLAETRRQQFRSGIGLPGAALEKRTAVTAPDLVNCENFPRAPFAASAGLYSGVAFPVKVGAESCGVIEFYTVDPVEVDDKLLNMLDAIGSEIGQFIERKRIESEREGLLQREKLLREEAEKANRMKDEFLATLSHELRTPLNSILGWSQIVLNDMVDKAGLQTALETIHRNATAQAQLIEELLEASRLITGKVLLNLEPTEINRVIETAIDIVRPRAAAKEIDISFEMAAGDEVITSDPTRLQQMVWNLLTNAIKFTPRGGKIGVRTERVDTDLQIIVSDTGIGIAPDFLPFVFDRFRQQDSTSTRRHDGLGLGLAIVRQLAELHGGSVFAKSDGQDKGSTFVISLPTMPGVASASAMTETAAEDARSTSADDLKGVLIHVVDDDADSCSLLEFAFNMRGARVVTSSSAADAFARIADDPPDVLLADINMPDEDGYSLIKRVRELSSGREPAIPAIALTAMARAEDSDRALAAGFDLHVPKPVEIDELASTIQHLLDQEQRSVGA